MANEARIGVDRDGNIIVAFTRFPVVRKYSRKGQLIWETDLSQQNSLIRKYVECEAQAIPSRVVENSYLSFPHTQGLGFGENGTIHLVYGRTLLVSMSKQGSITSVSLLLAPAEGEDVLGNLILGLAKFINVQTRGNDVYVPHFGQVIKFPLRPTTREMDDSLVDFWCSADNIPFGSCSVTCKDGSCSAESLFGGCSCGCDKDGKPSCGCEGLPTGHPPRSHQRPINKIAVRRDAPLSASLFKFSPHPKPHGRGGEPPSRASGVRDWASRR